MASAKRVERKTQTKSRKGANVMQILEGIKIVIKIKEEIQVMQNQEGMQILMTSSEGKGMMLMQGNEVNEVNGK